MDTKEAKTEPNMNEETLAGKLAAAEAMIAQMSKDKEVLTAERTKLQEPLKLELTKRIDALPESVKKRFIGKEMDPVDGLKEVAQAAEEYKAIEAEAKAKVQAEIDAYRTKLKENHGINIPELDKVMYDASNNNSKDAPRTNLNGSDNSVPLAKKDNLSTTDVMQITSGFNNMSKWLEEKYK